MHVWTAWCAALLVHGGGSALPPDKACSACQLVSAAITSALHALRDDEAGGAAGAQPADAARWLSERVRRECGSWRNLALTGEEGARAYIEMSTALGAGRVAGRAEATLANVVMGAHLSLIHI